MRVAPPVQCTFCAETLCFAKRMAHRLCYRRAWPARDILKPFDVIKEDPHRILRRVLTILGAINEAKVSRFSGGGPPLAGPMITSVSPETTSFTVPRNHPVAIVAQQSQQLMQDSTSSSHDNATHATLANLRAMYTKLRLQNLKLGFTKRFLKRFIFQVGPGPQIGV